MAVVATEQLSPTSAFRLNCVYLAYTFVFASVFVNAC